MGKANKKLRGLLAALDKIHAKAPHVLCQGKCQRACGPIAEAVLPIELERVRVYLQRPDFEFASIESVRGIVQDHVDCEMCPLLSPEGACSVHSVRPLICRLWGAANDPLMRCPYGCAGDLISNAEARALWNAIRQLDAQRNKHYGQAVEGPGSFEQRHDSDT